MPKAEKSKIASVLSKAIGEAGALFATDPDTAEKNAAEILRLAPGQPHALALLVGARRLAGDLPGARSALEELAKADPNLASIQYELGLVLRDIGDRDAAIAALSKVVELEPFHTSAWRELGDLLARAKRMEAAANSYTKHFEACAAEARTIDPGASPALDQLPSVERALETWVNQHPTDVVALRLLGAVYMKLGRLERAERLLAQAVELSPDFAMARLMLATVLNRRARWETAIPHAERLLQKNPDDSDYLNLLAEALMNAGHLERAIGCFERLLSKDPSAANWMYYGHALRAVRRTEDCIAAYRTAISLKPDFGQAYWSLANLKTFRFETLDIDKMTDALQEKDLDRNSSAQMHFALGKALEDAKEYERSFRHYQSANAVWRKELQYDPDFLSALVRRSKDVFTAEFFRARSGAGCADPAPIFVIGLPRSGTTLIEQILASHSMVEGAGELIALKVLAERFADIERTQGENYPEIIRDYPAEELRMGGEEYLRRAKPFRRLGKAFFVDKMPNNFQHLGLLLTLLPNAKIIDARRHPLGTGFANFKQFYAEGLLFSFDQVEIGRYYRDYVELVAHFDEVFPGRMHRVFYEQMVTNTESEVRRLLEYCGLPFEESCLRFHETKRAVMTASSEQVQRPVYTESVAQWRHYETWLGPMKEALGDVLASYPAVPKSGTPFTPYTISWGSPNA